MKRTTMLSDLVLATILLSSWEEKVMAGKVVRAWKGYPFETLDSLQDAGLIHQTKTAKSLYLTDEGVKKAREILKELGHDTSKD